MQTKNVLGLGLVLVGGFFLYNYLKSNSTKNNSTQNSPNLPQNDEFKKPDLSEFDRIKTYQQDRLKKLNDDFTSDKLNNDVKLTTEDLTVNTDKKTESGEYGAYDGAYIFMGEYILV